MNKESPLKTNIKSVTLYFPKSLDGEVVCYEVGKRGVTQILETQRYTECCLVNYYEIYKNGQHDTDIHHFSLVEYLT